MGRRKENRYIVNASLDVATRERLDWLIIHTTERVPEGVSVCESDVLRACINYTYREFKEALGGPEECESTTQPVDNTAAVSAGTDSSPVEQQASYGSYGHVPEPESAGPPSTSAGDTAGS